MRYVVYGAGAVGGVVGGLLSVAGREVALIARGAHLQAIRADGLTVQTPDATHVLRLEFDTNGDGASVGNFDTFGFSRSGS